MLGQSRSRSGVGGGWVWDLGCQLYARPPQGHSVSAVQPALEPRWLKQPNEVGYRGEGKTRSGKSLSIPCPAKCSCPCPHAHSSCLQQSGPGESTEHSAIVRVSHVSSKQLSILHGIDIVYQTRSYSSAALRPVLISQLSRHVVIIFCQCPKYSPNVSIP